MAMADKVIAFLNRLPISSGAPAGRKFQGRPWQEDILRQIYRPGVRDAVIRLPRKQGKTTLVAGLVLALPYTPVRSVVWKKTFGLGKDKEQARLRAQQLFPAADLRRKRDHGRAEALLLAHWALAGSRAIPQGQSMDRADHGSTQGSSPYAQGTRSEHESIASSGASLNA